MMNARLFKLFSLKLLTKFDLTNTVILTFQLKPVEKLYFLTFIFTSQVTIEVYNPFKTKCRVL